MAFKKRRRRRRRDIDYRIYDPKDGIDIHRIISGGAGKASRRKLRMSQYEYDSVYVEIGNETRAVSIMHQVRKINRYKSFSISSDKEKINRKA